MSDNIAAWTEITVPQRGYVQCVSINRTGDYSALVEITVRQQDQKQAVVVMSKAEFALLLLQAGRNV